jgi:short subunit fatty acids transporter
MKVILYKNLKVFLLPYFLILKLYHGNQKTIRAVKEATDDVAALLCQKIIYNVMVNIQKAADVYVKQSISTISTFALIAKVGKTDQFPKITFIFNGLYICCCCTDFGWLNCIQNCNVSSIRYIN